MLRHPLWALADLGQPPGQGDKVVLRAVAKSLGLKMAAARVKRADMETFHFGDGMLGPMPDMNRGNC